MTKFTERLKKNLDEWFERKKTLSKGDYNMLKGFTYSSELETKKKKKPDYEKGYHIIMEYFDILPNEDQHIVNEKLKEVGL